MLSPLWSGMIVVYLTGLATMIFLAVYIILECRRRKSLKLPNHVQAYPDVPPVAIPLVWIPNDAEADPPRATNDHHPAPVPVPGGSATFTSAWPSGFSIHALDRTL